MAQFREYEIGAHVFFEGAPYEVVERANTRFGSPTYRVRELGGEVKRWLTPPRAEKKPKVLDKEGVRAFVEMFYAKVADDDLIGPVFDRRIHGEWGPHLDTMVLFWSAVLLREMNYRGSPPDVHRAIQELEPRMFKRWLEIFHETMHELFEEPLAASLYQRAERIAHMLSTNVLGQPFSMMLEA